MIVIISNNPQRGYHNCPLSTVNCPLQPCDKHQFTGVLTKTDGLTNNLLLIST